MFFYVIFVLWNSYFIARDSRRINNLRIFSNKAMQVYIIALLEINDVLVTLI